MRREDATWVLNLSFLDPHWEVLPETVRSVQEGVYYADRKGRDSALDLRWGLFFTEDGTKVLSLAVGSDLHAYRTVDYELYGFRGVAVEDVCCHDSLEEAEACALHVFLHDRWHWEEI